jgi:hypothetical protein
MTKEQYEQLEKLILSMQKKDNANTIIKTVVTTLLPLIISSAIWIVVFSSQVKEDIKYLNTSIRELKADYEKTIKKTEFNKTLKSIDHNFKTLSNPQDKIINIYDSNN